MLGAFIEQVIGISSGTDEPGSHFAEQAMRSTSDYLLLGHNH